MRDIAMATLGGAIILAVDRMIDGRFFWSLGYMAIACLLLTIIREQTQ